MREGIGRPACSDAHTFNESFQLDSGLSLPEFTLAFNTYGKLNAARNNCIIVGHSLTSNSCVHEWWDKLLGNGPAFALDSSKYFIVCVNYVCSVYGSSCPIDINPRTNELYMSSFPIISIRDNVRMQYLLLTKVLNVNQIYLAIGGSLGGMLAMEWAACYPQFVKHLCVIASCPRHSDWGIGIGEAERQAIYNDSCWNGGKYPLTDPPLRGMAVARQFAMLTYRTPHSFEQKFQRQLCSSNRPEKELLRQGHSADPSTSKFYEVERYLNYQGDKFIKRFDPLCYVRLTQSLDTHDLGKHYFKSSSVTQSEDRDEQDLYKKVLSTMTQPTLIIGIDSDLLYPLSIQEEMHELLPTSTLYVISSPHGHDSFLIEMQQVNDVLMQWFGNLEHVRPSSPLIHPPVSETDERVNELLARERRASAC
jgi:homoserine O-acetyltransferase